MWLKLELDNEDDDEITQLHHIWEFLGVLCHRFLSHGETFNDNLAPLLSVIAMDIAFYFMDIGRL